MVDETEHKASLSSDDAETRQEWLAENAAALAKQAEWHDRQGHPLSDIISAPGRSTWTR
ncbi:hypothetical protein [Citreimonas salinaria]|uniref:Uncharacterized protein n=1 Tax=Citreimonas salinaria TaxID=321339 RepID=A0A1H3LZC1_9RHOB|nr:hypothetical protein [Citreimonas salinaria]SDY69676.1 hypothetical protein SAMN05444340_11512 [Citreimonas salinaria]